MTDKVSYSGQGFSFVSEMPLHGDILSVGDQLLPAALPTDFNPMYGFFSRGISLRTKKRERTHWMVFFGAAEIQRATSYSTAGIPQTPLAIFTYDHPLFAGLTFSSYEIASSRQTAVESLSWAHDDRMKCSASLGIGANSPFAATLCNWKSKRWDARGGYTFAGANFRPIQLSSQIQTFTENVGLNATVSFSPIPKETFTVTHENILTPPLKGNEERASVETVSAYRALSNIFIHGSASEGVNSQNGVVSTSEGIGGGISLRQGKILVTDDFFRTNRGDMQTATFTETVARRLNLTQYVTRESGRTNVEFGGSYTGNSISASVSYSEVFNPLMAGIPYQKQMNVRVTFNTRHSTVSLGTYVTPTGQTKYEAFTTDYVNGPYRGGSSGNVTHSVHGKYEIAGAVLDTAGAPVPGAVVSVDGVDCVSDVSGKFGLRVRKDKPAVVKVRTDYFLSGSWEIVTAPATATPGTQISIIVRRK